MSQEYLTGIFKKEIKNRFLCSVEINGEENVCYIPSSCRLSNFLDMNNRNVILKPNNSSSSRTRYSVYAISYLNKFIPVNLSEANRVVEKQISSRLFSFLGKRKNVYREKTIDGYKSDLFIEDTNTLIEIKCLLAFEKQTCFPTVYSERALKQLEDISKLLDKGYKVAYIIVSLNPSVKKIEINRKMIEYYEQFSKCISKGMICKCFSLDFTDLSPSISKSVHIRL